MSNSDEFYTPEKVDEQISRVSQSLEGESTDSEALAYLRSTYSTDATQERQALDRMWNRIAGAAPSNQKKAQNELPKGKILPMKTYQTQYTNPPPPPKRRSLAQRLGVLAAALFLVILVGSLALVFYSVRQSQNNTGTGTPTVAPTVHPATPTPVVHVSPTIVPVPLKVLAVTMAVDPTSIAGTTCGTNLTVTYTAKFYVSPNNTGGVVKFYYSVNNGRGQTPASLTFAKGQTLGTYRFQWSGALPIDHTYPEPGGVQVTSPNVVNSPMLGPTGACSPAAFRVTGVTMAVNPASVAGMKCGTNVTVTYTATFAIAPDSNGGTIQFQYTVNNGRGTTLASLAVAPGNTTATYSFSWSGALPPDHTMPEPGGVLVTGPNALNAVLIAPTGRCS